MGVGWRDFGGDFGGNFGGDFYGDFGGDFSWGDENFGGLGAGFGFLGFFRFGCWGWGSGQGDAF